MTRPRLAVLAAVFFSSVAVPALAAWDHLGSVNFTVRDRDQSFGPLGGSVEALNLMARDSDVVCRDVTATLGNGQTRTVYQGVLPRGREVMIDLPGGERFVRRLDFNCRSESVRGSEVDIAADIGRFRAEWRRSPDWDRVWSRMFNWTDEDRRFSENDRFGGDRYIAGPVDTAGWINLGSRSFEGAFDREVAFNFERRDVGSIGLRPINDDARCDSITTTFSNGGSRTFRFNPRDVLPEGQIHTIDIPGREDIARIDMACHAEHGREVTIQVLASR
ncbi:MAG TPA: hypothetical protein VEU06_05660 [Micropepsaceae bacterium]|nr:hypothetical protein [Micropepsaceae bacterium]